MGTLYKKIDNVLYYWESWENDDNQSANIYFGKVGEEGVMETITSDSKLTYTEKLTQKINSLEGYLNSSLEDFKILIIEYAVEDLFGTEEDLKKRYNLQDRMQETLDRIGLGFCDGGSVGDNTMEVCCFVIDFEIAKNVIQQELKNTEYDDYTKIYLEEE